MRICCVAGNNSSINDGGEAARTAFAGGSSLQDSLANAWVNPASNAAVCWSPAKFRITRIRAARATAEEALDLISRRAKAASVARSKICRGAILSKRADLYIQSALMLAPHG